MPNFRAWVEETRSGGYSVRHENPDGKRETDYRLDAGVSAIIDGKKVVGKNLANILCEKVRQRFYSNEAGEALGSDEAIIPLIERFILVRESNNYSPNTLKHDRNSLQRMVIENDLRLVSDITREVLVNWKLNMTQRKQKVSTIRGVLSDVRAFLNWLVEEKKLKVSPFGKKMMPASKDPEPRYYTPVEFAALDEALAQVNYPTRLLCNLAHSAGLRKAEALGVTWEDITWKDNGKAELLVRKEISKGKRRSGTVPLDYGLVELLGSRKTGLLVQASRIQIDHFFQRARVLAKLDKKEPALTIHGLRHTFAKNHLQSGMGSLPSLKDLLRDSTLAAVSIYAQFEPTHHHEAIDEAYRRRKIAEKIAGQKTTPIHLQGNGRGKGAESLDGLKPNDTNRDVENDAKRAKK